MVNGGEFNNPDVLRIVSVTLTSLDENAPEEPYYDEMNNVWLYGVERNKRGGYQLTYEIETEKIYPDVGFTFSKKAGKRNIYNKITNNTTTIYGMDINETALEREKLNEFCIKSIISIPKSKVTHRDASDIGIEFKGIDAGNALESLTEIFKNCPVYLKRFVIVNSEAMGEIVAFKKED